MTYRTLRQGEIVPPNAEFLCEGEWLNTSCAGLLPTAGPEYRVPIDEPEPTTEMSNQINDGGTAFPVPDSHHANGQVQYGSNGMSLRDYFAGQALAGVLANPILLELHEDYAMTAKACINFADAMIEARNQEQPQ